MQNTDLEEPVTEFWIDRCFEKLKKEYPGFSVEECTKMLVLFPTLSAAIDLHWSASKITLRDLKEFYDLHIQIWKAFKVSQNSLSDRLKEITL
jgi:hypothetical protein